mmetsp:Transcript_9903/g.18622  ORF Transcript_9903/g.18622 Transcript_9903/m.18622 type:complete len:207 (-) Transcript_9903:82-702(-)
MKRQSLDRKIAGAAERDSEDSPVVTRRTTMNEQEEAIACNRRRSYFPFQRHSHSACTNSNASSTSYPPTSYPSEKMMGNASSAVAAAAGDSVLQYATIDATTTEESLISATSSSPLPIHKPVECIEEDIVLHSERHKYNISTWEMYQRITSARMLKQSRSIASSNMTADLCHAERGVSGSPQQQQCASGNPSTSCTPADEPFDLDY